MNAVNKFKPRKGFENLTSFDLRNMTVGAHWNSRLHLYSIVHMKSKHSVGLVIGYSEELTLGDCYIHIAKSEQKKVQSGTHKNRHAFICGKILDFDGQIFSNRMYYNPRELDSFVDKYEYEIMNSVEYLENMDYVGMAKVKSKNKPFVTYNERVKKVNVG